MDTKPNRRGKSQKALGRAASIGLTKAQIIEVGIGLIDETGLEGFSIRELSRRLNVYPAAIYWHLGGSKADLLSEFTAEITAHLIKPDEIEGDWRDILRTLCYRYREASQKHPHLANMIGAHLQANGPPHAGLVEVILRALRKAGYDDIPMIDTMNAFIGGIFGYVTMELAPDPPGANEKWSETFRHGLQKLDPEKFPETNRMLPNLMNRAFAVRWSNGAKVPLDGGFSILVEALIYGIEQRRETLMASATR